MSDDIDPLNWEPSAPEPDPKLLAQRRERMRHAREAKVARRAAEIRAQAARMVEERKAAEQRAEEETRRAEEGTKRAEEATQTSEDEAKEDEVQNERLAALLGAEPDGQTGTVRTRSPVSPTASPPREERSLDGLNERRRLSRYERGMGGLEVPESERKPGWDYAFFPDTIMGQPVEHLAPQMGPQALEEGGWEPELARDHPRMVKHGTDPNSVVRRGSHTLYCRPKHLTLAALEEDLVEANKQLRDKILGATEGRLSGSENQGMGLADIRGVRPVGAQIEIVGEAGIYANKR
jgi:hypothetical protein